jgi:hypothetical protein
LSARGNSNGLASFTVDDYLSITLNEVIVYKESYRNAHELQPVILNLEPDVYSGIITVYDTIYCHFGIDNLSLFVCDE